jgi:hypothetical protein
MADVIDPARPVRTCIGCGQSDDHPKDQVVLGAGESVFWHMDCHVIATGCESCRAQIAGADGATGSALHRHLMTKGG